MPNTITASNGKTAFSESGKTFPVFSRLFRRSVTAEPMPPEGASELWARWRRMQAFQQVGDAFGEG